RVDRRLLRSEVVAHLLRPVPGGHARADEHELAHPVRLRERGPERDRAPERVADEIARQMLGDSVDEREGLGRHGRLAPAGQVRRDDLELRSERLGLPAPETRVPERRVQQDDAWPGYWSSSVGRLSSSCPTPRMS